MKRLIVLTMLILAVCSLSKAQTDTPADRIFCRDCPAGAASQVKDIAIREARARAVAEHNQWPSRPQLTNPSKDRRPRFARLTANFSFANDSYKKIKQITWECTLVSLTSGQTIASYTMVTRKGIAPHSTALLSQSVMVPLQSFYTKVISAGHTTQNNNELPKVVQAEQINKVREIRYKDGTISTP